MIDLSIITDEDIKREYWRRINARRSEHTAGRKRVLRPCELCGEPFGAREMLAHVPQCKKAIVAAMLPTTKKARVK